MIHFGAFYALLNKFEIRNHRNTGTMYKGTETPKPGACQGHHTMSLGCLTYKLRCVPSGHCMLNMRWHKWNLSLKFDILLLYLCPADALQHDSRCKFNVHCTASERARNCEYCWCRKRYGLAEFLPRSLLSSAESFRLLTSDASSVDRSLRRRLSRLIDETRRARNKAGKPLGSLQIKLQYLRVISQLPSYGIRCFLVRKLKPRLHVK